MQDSLLRPKHGGNLVWASQVAGCSPTSILDFSASISPLGPPPGAIAAIQAHLQELCHYPDPNYGQLRQALGDFHALSADWILPGNGAAELLTWAGRDFSELTSVFLITPAFGDYHRALDAFSSSIVQVPLAVETLDSNRSTAIPRSCPVPLNETVGMGVLINNPHNPTGQLFSAVQLRQYLEHFALVVVDEAFMDFLPPHQQQSVIEWVPSYSNLVVVRSLTKFYSLPGLRIGYAIAHPERLQRWQQWRDPWSVNGLATVAAIAALQDTDFQQKTWHWLAEARSNLFDQLATLPTLTPYPSAANYLLVKVEGSAAQLQQKLLQRHQILIRDCLSFPDLGDRFFRIAIRTQPENQRLVEGLADSLTNR